MFVQHIKYSFGLANMKTIFAFGFLRTKRDRHDKNIYQDILSPTWMQQKLMYLM